MTAGQLCDLRQRAGITQTQAAELAGVALRTMQQYEAGDRQIPRSVSGLLCLSCITLGGPAEMLAPWLPPPVAQRLMQLTQERAALLDDLAARLKAMSGP